MKPLNSLTKRDLLAAKKFDPEAIRQYGEQYLADGRYGDAYEFFRKLGNAECVSRVKTAAVAVADVEVLWRIEHNDHDAISREDWQTCGENAVRLEKFRDAAFAFRHSGDAARQAAAEQEFMPAPAIPPAP